MDTGVGIIVFAAGAGFGFSSRRFTNLNDILQVLVTIAIGVIRVISVKAINYHEKYSEYGVHWNFFFTLAVNKIICELFFRRKNTKGKMLAFGLIIPVAYEILLETPSSKLGFLSSGLQFLRPSVNGQSFSTLAEFILNADHLVETPKNSSLLFKFYVANREGIYSNIGYFAIFTLGNYQATFYLKETHFQHKNNKMLTELENFKIKKQNLMTMQLKATMIMNFIILPILYYLGLNPSRRMANLFYIFWMNGVCIILGYWVG